MSEFYAELSRYYDTIFPAEGIITGFLAGRLPQGGRVLDIACGTGAYSFELAARGFEVAGIDLDREMIAKASEKTSGGNPVFLAGDMVDGLGGISGPFDGMFCVGNSLPHLGTIEEVKSALAGWRSLLVAGGGLFIQVVNFRRFNTGKEEPLPSIENEGCVFTRSYLPGGSGKVVFSASLEVPGKSEVFRNSVDLLILTRELLDDMLLESGFELIEHRGGYDGSPFDPQRSFLLICGARAV